MKITIGIPVFNQEEQTLKCLRLLEKNTVSSELEIILIDNGSTVPLITTLEKNFTPIFFHDNNVRVIRNDTNLGVRPALNQIFSEAVGEVIVYTHNDVEMYQKGWDNVVREAFLNHPKAGIVGAYGAKGIGTEDIYETLYMMQQLARRNCVSNARMDKTIHGFRNMKSRYENVAVFDGFFMAIKKELLDRTNGFSDILPIHHSYDNLICIQSLQLDYENILISLDVTHVGGQTDVKEDWTKGTGKTKAEIHADAHPPLYEYGKGVLPIVVMDILDAENNVTGYQLFINRKHIKTEKYGR